MPTQERRAEVQKLVDVCLVLCEQLTGTAFFTYQTEMADRIFFSLLIEDAEDITIEASRQSGKSETLACVIATAMIIFPKLAEAFPDDEVLQKYKNGVEIGCFAPVDEQADTIFGRVETRLSSDQAKVFMSDPEINDEVRKSGNVLKTNSGSLCRRQTAHAKAKIESKTYHLVIIDEAQEADTSKVTKCYAAETPVWLSNGQTAPIEKVVHDQLPVLAWDGDQITEQTPLEWHENGIKSVWRVELSSGRFVEVTANHRWVVRNRSHGQRKFETTTDQLQPGWSVPVPLETGFFGDYGDRHWGYFIGAMLGDGCFSGSSPMWCGRANGSLGFMVEYVKKYGVEAHISHVQSSGLLEMSFTKPGNRENPLTGYLRDAGFWGMKSTGKHFPETNPYSAEFWRGAIAGLIDTDGCVEQTARRVSIASISERMLRQAQDGLLRLGIQSSLFWRRQNGGFGENSHDLWILTVKDVRSLRLLAEQLELKDEEKAQKLIALVESRKEAQGRRVWSEEPSWAWDRVVAVRPMGEKNTFCVTVDDPHLFVVNGILGSNSIHPMTTATAGTIVKVGTPAAYKSDYYEACQRNRHRRPTNGKRNHFAYDWKRAARENPRYAKSIEKEKRRLGEDSDEFRLSYDLVWLLERGMFITDERLRELGDPEMEQIQFYTDTPIVIGIDVAKKHDSTVCTALWVDWEHPDEFGLYNHRILSWLELHGENWESQYRQICDFVSHYYVMRIGVDAQGMGDPVAERLQVLLPSIEVLPMPMNPVDQSERWTHLMQLIQRGLIGWPAGTQTRRTQAWKRFMLQMSNVEKEYKGRYLLVGAPPNEKNAHDDYIDSLALATFLTKEFGQIAEVEQWTSNPLMERMNYRTGAGIL